MMEQLHIVSRRLLCCLHHCYYRLICSSSSTNVTSAPLHLTLCQQQKTRRSAVAEIPRDALRHVKSGLVVGQGNWK